MADGPYRSPLWPGVRQEILERDRYVCQVRGPKCKGTATQADHIVPWRDGGAWFDPANLRAACGWCNTWRAQQQKNREGWKRSATKIILVIGPPGAPLTAYVNEHAAPRDLIVDYYSIVAAIGDRPDQVKRLRNSLLTQLRRGAVKAPAAWLTSSNPDAEHMFPHHEVVLVDPGIEDALAHVQGPEHLVTDWYERRAEPEEPSLREW